MPIPVRQPAPPAQPPPPQPASQTTAIALYPYNAQQPVRTFLAKQNNPLHWCVFLLQGDLGFQKDDVITVLDMTGNWWEGTIGGRRGKFPKNYVQVK